jgi:hypothetical protein
MMLSFRHDLEIGTETLPPPRTPSGDPPAPVASLAGGGGGDAAWGRFLRRLAPDLTQSHALVARNFLLDEGVVPRRAESYRAKGAMADHGTVERWSRVHESYLAEHVFRPPPGGGLPATVDPADEDSCPETFRSIDPDSLFLSTDSKVHLVRVERLRAVAERAGELPERLKSLAQEVVTSGTPEARRTLDSLLAVWEKNAEVRPTFAAFLEDIASFGDDADAVPPGWADDLRDALGLAHLDPGDRTSGGALDILVFRYPVADVPSLTGHARVSRPLVPPTVLDGRHSPAFCPAPHASLTGHVIDLGARTKSPRREVLHPSAPFRAKHLWRVGTIVRPVDFGNLATARGVHLLLVRTASGRADYAQSTDGDLLA